MYMRIYNDANHREQKLDVKEYGKGEKGNPFSPIGYRTSLMRKSRYSSDLRNSNCIVLIRDCFAERSGV